MNENHIVQSGRDIGGSVICPSCGTHVPDNSLICPACHADLTQTNSIPKLQGTYCPSCGALVPPGETHCPKCGMPVAASHCKKVAPEAPAEEVPEEEAEKEDTHEIPRIESSIPSEEEIRKTPYGREHLPRTRVVLFASIAALLLVGGITLYITHPWDPNANVTHATTAADTSQAGYPGAVTSLKGQDSSSSSAATTTLSGDAATFQSLSECYTQLGTIASELDDNQATFDQNATSTELSTRVAGKNKADSISLEVSNLISSIGQLDTSTGTYSQDIANMTTLGNYLRNRCDALTQAWNLDVESNSPQTDIDKIKAPLTKQLNSSGVDTYKGLFDTNYASWKPVQKGS